jgi:hypothetical protein
MHSKVQLILAVPALAVVALIVVRAADALQSVTNLF